MAIIRISGPASADVLQKLMEPTNGAMPKPRYAAVRKLSTPIFDDCFDVDEDEEDNNNTNDIDIDALDEALVLYFPHKNSFTGEETVELQCHGSRGVISGILDCLGHAFPTYYRLRAADRGEFTQRAYEAGRLNLLQIEALADLIVSETSAQRRLALKELSRENSSYITYDDWRTRLTKALAHAEAVIDFGDDEENIGADEEVDVWIGVRENVSALRSAMESHLCDGNRGEITRDGMRVAIIGPPNAGKSTLLNYLAKRDVAIVSDVAGTTRDVVEVALDLGGIKCIVSDTAGLRSEQSSTLTDGDDVIIDVVEVEGMKRARDVAQRAHFTICVVDASCNPKEAMQQLFSELQSSDAAVALDPSNTIFVANKVDLLLSADNHHDNNSNNNSNSNSNNNNIELAEALSNDIREAMMMISAAANENANENDATIQATTTSHNNQQSSEISAFGISCAEGHGVESFLGALTSKVVARVAGPDSDDKQGSNTAVNVIGDQEGAVITRARHRGHVQHAVEALRKFDALSHEGAWALDLAAEELRLAASELGRVVGAVDVEDVLDVLFSDFCIGK